MQFESQNVLIEKLAIKKYSLFTFDKKKSNSTLLRGDIYVVKLDAKFANFLQEK